jgi:hypothetical protein
MKTDKLIQLHETAAAILQAVVDVIGRKQLTIDSINGFPGQFLSIRKQLLHRVEILDMVITRLENRYFNLTIKITEVQNGKASNEDF